MKEVEFKDEVYREMSYREINGQGNIIKAEDATINGFAKISIDQETSDGVKIILKKDSDDNIKEIKFICSCGETKSVILDYSEE